MDIWWAGLGIEEVREEVGAKARVEFETFADRWVGERPNVSPTMSDVNDRQRDS